MHFRTRNLENNTWSDKYTGNEPGTGHFDTGTFGGGFTRFGDDGSLTVFDADGKVVRHHDAPEKPDTRSNWQKAWDGAGNFLEGVGHSAEGMGLGLAGMAGLRGGDAFEEAWVGMGTGVAALGIGVSLLAIDGFEAARGAPGGTSTRSRATASEPSMPHRNSSSARIGPASPTTQPRPSATRHSASACTFGLPSSCWPCCPSTSGRHTTREPGHG
ncbi:hypothetical protein [Nocardia gipuzkoensis]|uniref:hypothetical protein n=1 Tax=Nocardia gipuzkoensis TaxID=2749991 RepID=UPI003EDEA320